MLGIGIDYVRHHVISQRVKEDHVIRHMTCLGASKDLHKSRRDLELSEIQHMILKTFRDERRIATKSTIAKGIFQRGSHMRSREYNNLYCTNRTSLGNSFYAKGIVYIHKSQRSYWNVVEGNRRS